MLSLFFTANAWAKDVSSFKFISDSEIQKVVVEAYETYRNDNRGKNADYIKALAKVDPKIFGITVATADGKVFEAGDTKAAVSIQSISKVFTASLVMKEKGGDFVRKKIGVNATGLPFNSILAIELHGGSASNPFVNAGAIQATSWVSATSPENRWEKIKANMDAYAGHRLTFNHEVYRSELYDNKRNQAIAKLLDAYGRMGSDPIEATTVYTRQCSVNVTSHDLAIMGATLANHGVNPVTGKRLLDKKSVPGLLAIMATAGLYDNAGDWLYSTGAPAKSGVGGGMLAVIPGRLAIGVVSPPLDKFGNSVRGQEAIIHIINKLGLNPYAQ
jgi:glutaminase